MDIPRKDAGRKRLIRRIIIGTIVVVAVPAITIGFTKLKPAAPTMDASTPWIDTVKRGSMRREVHGLGTLVPEETLLIPASTDGRVERILVEPGTPVKPNTVVMILTNPELETALLDAQYALKVAEADYSNLKVTLEKQNLDLQSTAAQVGSDYNTAKLQADRDAALSKEGLFADVDAKISAVKASELANRYKIEQQRLAIDKDAVAAQLASQQVKVEQLRAEYKLKQSQVNQLKVTAGAEGMLQQLPTPVEVGQKVTAGTPLGKVAQPSKLKAELKIAETQVKDVAIGQAAVIDTRNGLINGHVSRIDPSVLNGTVTVDVKLQGPLPPSARPDLSVDGTIELELLNDVLYVGRPVYGNADSTVQLFKLEPDGKYANRVKVQLGRTSVSYIEIKDGLKAGDRVILSDMSAYDNYDRIRLN
ncbi:MAG TPA: HlyD family efflux transporter periplasmic adaptor subunit [Bryobacteraceae bacterium]|nr:HlyD family efflux transporter periplasmic adaptor subunit [Bryobacteraceae bacterium]